MVVTLLLLVACATEGQRDGALVDTSVDDAPHGTAARMSPAPTAVREACAASSVDACPSSLPAVDVSYKVRSLELDPSFAVVDISAGGPYPGLVERNAPPRFAHVIVREGDLDDAFSFENPEEDAASPVDRLHRVPESLGVVSWGSREGRLVLAPKFPAGGIDGGHLIFISEDDGSGIAISMHAWSPLEDAIATLRQIASSLG